MMPYALTSYWATHWRTHKPSKSVTYIAMFACLFVYLSTTRAIRACWTGVVAGDQVVHGIAHQSWQFCPVPFLECQPKVGLVCVYDTRRQVLVEAGGGVCSKVFEAGSVRGSSSSCSSSSITVKKWEMKWNEVLLCTGREGITAACLTIMTKWPYDDTWHAGWATKTDKKKIQNRWVFGM